MKYGSLIRFLSAITFSIAAVSAPRETRAQPPGQEKNTMFVRVYVDTTLGERVAIRAQAFDTVERRLTINTKVASAQDVSRALNFLRKIREKGPLGEHTGAMIDIAPSLNESARKNEKEGKYVFFLEKLRKRVEQRDIPKGRPAITMAVDAQAKGKSA